jgi:hypothetical protein
MSWDSILAIISIVGFLAVLYTIRWVWNRGLKEETKDPYSRNDVRLPPVG